ncbi:MAG: hypothetical protein PVJ72_01710 [Gammaproteobacteria bacterium]|jgi:hypothetical protein
MGKLNNLLKNAYEGKDIQERVYGRFPFEIAEQCGADEVREIILKLDELYLEKEQIEEWDGDSQDDIWSSQKDFSALLERLTEKFAKEIAAGLKSQYPETRFWVAGAFANAPSPEVVTELAEYLLNEMPEHHRSLGQKALRACKSKQSIFIKLFVREWITITSCGVRHNQE